MCKYLQDPNFWVSIVSVSIAFIALFQSSKQTKLSNKQSLFDRRMENYSLFRELFKSYSKSRNLLLDNDELYEEPIIAITMLTNTPYLNDIYEAYKKPLDSNAHKNFLNKYERLDKCAFEIRVLWDDSTGKTISEFVRVYHELLFKLYQQRICIHTYEEFNKQYSSTPELMMKRERVVEKLEENSKSIKLFECIKEIDDLYKKITEEKLDEKIAEKMKFKD